MALYEYVCGDCGSFEAIVPADLRDQRACPGCQGLTERRVSHFSHKWTNQDHVYTREEQRGFQTVTYADEHQKRVW